MDKNPEENGSSSAQRSPVKDNLELFEIRGGARALGVEYEDKVTANFSLLLAQDPSIRDFKISSNDPKYGNFDDLVIEVEYNGNGLKETAAVQLKHQQAGKPVSMQSFSGDNKGDFSLFKYFKETEKAKIPEEVSLVLFTNRKYDINQKCEKEENKTKNEPNKTTSNQAKGEPHEDPAVESEIFQPESNKNKGTHNQTKNEANKDSDNQTKDEPINKGTSNHPKDEANKNTNNQTKNKPNKGQTKVKSNKGPKVELEIFQPEIENQPGLIKFIISKTQSKAYQFKVLEYEYDDSAPGCSLPPKKNFEEFLKRVYLFPSQDDVKAIEDKLNQQLLGESTYKLFMEFIENWNKEEKKFKLNKGTIIAKFMECLLWPHSVHECGDISGQDILFDKVFSKFDVTIFEEFMPAIKVYGEKFIEAKKAKIQLQSTWEVEKQFGLSISKKTDYVIRLLWHLNELPLIIKPNCPKVIRDQVLNLPKEENCRRRLLVVGTIDEEFGNRKILRNLSDFDAHDLEEYFKDKKIDLQGKKLPLVEYVKNDKELTTIFRTEEIVRLFLNKSPLFLGEEARDLSLYINRLLQKPIFRWNVLEDTSSSDKFVISCNGRNRDLENLKKKFAEKKQITIFEHPCSAQEFQKICSKNENKSVHHFQITEKNNLSWIATEGSAETLTEYLSQAAGEVVLDSEIFNEFTGKVNVLCADPGMGKSFLMEFLKQNSPKDLWPILINIREHVKIFEDDSFDRVVDGIIERKYEKNDLTRKIVDLMRNKKRILFIWDGLDEVPQEFYENILQAVNFISKKGYLQWVTSRNHLKNMLQQKLHLFALTLTQLDEDNQRFYIRKRLNCDSERENKIMTHLENPVHRDLLGTPLQLLILTEIYQKNSDALNFISLTEMYRKFVEMKFDTYERKMGNLEENIMIRTQWNKRKKDLLPKYQISGVLACFEEKLLQKLKVSQESNRNFLEEIKESGDEMGLVVGLMEDGTPLFIHQTYAEYLCALYLKENVSRIVNFLSEEIASDNKFHTIRYMLDMLLADGSKSHLAAIYGNVEMLEETGPLPKDLIGRTPVQLAFIYNRSGRCSLLSQGGNRNMYNVKFSELDWEENERGRQIKTKHFYNPDKFKSLNIFEYCQIIRSLYPLEVLLRLNNNEVNKSKIRNLQIFGKYICTYIICCLLNGFENLLLLVENIPSMRIEFDWTSGNNLLHFVARYARTKSTVLTKLLAMADLDINARNSSGNTPLLVATSYRPDERNLSTLNALRIIANDTSLDARDRSYYNRTALMEVSKHGRIDVVRCLVEMGAEVNSQDANGDTPILLAARGGCQDIVEFLTEKKADLNVKSNVYGDYVLLLAIKEKFNSSIINKLVQAGADVNAQNQRGDSLLLLAIENKLSSSIINKLIEGGADINAKDEFGNTPLSMLKLYGPEEIANRLILNNENVTGINDQNLRENLLLRASWKGQMDFVKILIEKEIAGNVKTPWGDTSLLCAIRYRYENIVKLLIQKGANPNEQNENGDTPLMFAVDDNNYFDEDITKILIKAGANVNTQNKDGDTPLIFAVKYKKHFYIRTIKILIEAGANINAQNKIGDTPLILAFGLEKDISYNVVNKLIQVGADVNTQNKYGDSPLLLAIENKFNSNLINKLIQHGAEINTKDELGNTPLLILQFYGREQIANRFILENENVIGINDQNLRENLLLRASRRGQMNYVKILMEKEIDVNVKTPRGDTSLLLAISCGQKDIVKFLIEKGANPNEQNESGDTPLTLTLTLQDINIVHDIVKILIEAEANVNTQNKVGDTPLIIALKLKKDIEIVHDIVKNLIESGADVNVPNKDGDTPLILALGLKNDFIVRHVVKELTEAGANVNAQNKVGDTPLSLAAKLEDKDIVQLLTQKSLGTFKEHSS